MVLLPDRHGLLPYDFVTTTKGRSERQQWNPDLGVLAARLHSQIQDEVFERLAVRGL